MSVENLRTGDRANVRFRFIKSPEYLRSGMKLVFREGRTKAIGSVSKLFPHVPSQTSNTRAKTRSQTAGAAASTTTTGNPITTDQSQVGKRNDSGEDNNRSGYKRSKQTKITTDTPTEQNIEMDKNSS
jgi:hypothetical protein